MCLLTFQKNYDVSETLTTKPLSDFGKAEKGQYQSSDDINCNIKIPICELANEPSTNTNSHTDNSPTLKERWAYAIEFTAKFSYPTLTSIVVLIWRVSMTDIFAENSLS